VLNDRTIKALKPAKPGKRYEVMDAIVPGLGVRVTERVTGAEATKTFVLVARYPGSTNPTRRALGKYGALSLEQAGTKARLARADQGGSRPRRRSATPKAGRATEACRNICSRRGGFHC